MKKLKMEKGITLVALLVTIVILIILAVVAITTIMNTDILGYADKSVDTYQEGKDNEATQMQGYENYLNGAGGTGGSGTTGSWLTLSDVPETTQDYMKYSVSNGRLTLSGPNNEEFWFYSNYTHSTTIQLPCTFSLTKGRTYELKLETDMYIGCGYKYITFSLPNVSGASVGTQGAQYPSTTETTVKTFTCQEDVQGTYINVKPSALTDHDSFPSEHYTLTLTEK